MRIFHVITLSSVGGAQSVVVNLANRQVDHNEVFVVSSSDGSAWKSLDPRVRVIPIRSLHRDISLRDIVVLMVLFWLRIKYSPDVVHLHSSKIGVLGRIAFASRKTIYTVHGFDSIRLANRPFIPIERRLQYFCRYIVGVSKYDEKNLVAEQITRNVCYIYNGIQDCNEINTEVSSDVIDRIENFRQVHSRIVMCVARDDAQKRLDLFLEIAGLLPQYDFVWIGNREQHEAPANVLFLGQVLVASKLLAYADLFLLTSNYEGLPMSIIEALAYGKPVVASAVGGVTELLTGENGYAIENDSRKMANKIADILSDDKIYEKMSARARETYEKEFRVNSMLDGYQKLYDNIFNK